MQATKKAEIGPKAADDKTKGRDSLAAAIPVEQKFWIFVNWIVSLSLTLLSNIQQLTCTFVQKRMQDDGKIGHITKTIDFIIMEEKYKHILQNSRVYRKTTRTTIATYWLQNWIWQVVSSSAKSTERPQNTTQNFLQMISKYVINIKLKLTRV